MTDMFRTKSGTVIVEGVEYGSYPPPDSLIKAMERRWAEPLLHCGSIRFGNLANYRAWENAMLGDPNDGNGMFKLNGRACRVGSVNQVFAWCSALPAITSERIMALAKHGKYDCLVRIHQPKILIERIRDSLVPDMALSIHCAEVSYNRGDEVDKVTLNSQKFHFNVFQKDRRFSDDREYRVSLTDTNLRPEVRAYIDLPIGECADIMTIEELPY
jgi:hypothetical protein